MECGKGRRGAPRRLVEDQRRAQAGDLVDRGVPRAAFRRQEAHEQEAVGRQAGERQRRDRRARPGHAHHRDAGGARVADQLVAGVGDQRRARIGDQCNHATLHPLQQHRAHRVGIVIVVRLHRHLRADVGEQASGNAGVLGGDQGRLCQDARGPRG